MVSHRLSSAMARSGFGETCWAVADTGSGDNLKVFISYSRRDSSDFAEELVAGLELAGFAPFLDRHDIAPGEPWEDRLSALIQQSDTVVYVISPEAVRSERCQWEVDRAVALSKPPDPGCLQVCARGWNPRATAAAAIRSI
jgi:hypothetical protein